MKAKARVVIGEDLEQYESMGMADKVPTAETLVFFALKDVKAAMLVGDTIAANIFGIEYFLVDENDLWEIIQEHLEGL